ncbi:MAG: sigma-54-dependent Fis family transcriptional regulator [Chitinispirillaceae bacterium]|nr:sigma-54-dependent Fis family transcriptional regulator [Chitinispirillaceae bacterium]
MNMVPVLRSLNENRQQPVSGRILTIGSSPDCHLQLTGLPLRAAHLLFSQGSYMVQRLKLDVKVLVNDIAVSTFGTPLHHGDIVKIGSHRLQFIERADDTTLSASASPPENAASTLHELIDIAVSLLRSRDEALFDGLVSSVARLLRGDGARLVVDDGTGAERRTIARYPQSVGLDRFSNRAIDWAREAARTVLMHEDEWKTETGSERSLEKNLVASIMCAPLKRGEIINGYLYIDRVNDAAPFTEEERSFCDALLPLFSEILINFQEKRQQQATIARLQEQQMAPAGGMLYQSDCMTQLIALATRLARTDSPVLITGETGTGKELLARFVHDQSQRKSGLYKAINCGAIPENLIESELFGHEKGAFTGATGLKTGLFESAQDGTLFLDEIGELPFHLQVKLLRVLQESEVVRVGGTVTIPVDVRIVTATNRDLEAEVRAGRFRQDLFFRLNVLTLELPPLRKRGDDILLLAEYFITRYCQQFGLAHKTLSATAKNLLVAHTWPGNVRELENTMQKAILLCETDRLTPENISIGKCTVLRGEGASGSDQTLREARADAERTAIVAALTKTHGNVSLAGRILDIDRKWLIKKMEELGVTAGEFRR